MTKPSRKPEYRQLQNARKSSVTMFADLHGLNDILAGIEEDVDAAVRPAAQAGAQFFYDEVLKNVMRLGVKSGNLNGAIYQAFSAENSGLKKATYHISWNSRKAPHGGLVEFGHIQRYAVHLGADGKWYTLVRPSMRGKPPPKRRASQAEKDAYYVIRSGGPRQIAAQPFIRPVFYKQGGAIAAVTAKFYDLIGAT